MPVSLRPIDLSNWEDCIELTVGPTQLGSVGSNVRSLAECWVRPKSIPLGIYENDQIVGFVMLVTDPITDHYDIHRIMVDFKHQGRGIGFAALQAIIDQVKSFPDRTDKLTIMFLVENAAAEALYKKAGFADSGDRIYNEKWRFTEKVFYYDFKDK